MTPPQRKALAIGGTFRARHGASIPLRRRSSLPCCPDATRAEAEGLRPDPSQGNGISPAADPLRSRAIQGRPRSC
jgi:hypothetical protein